MYCHFLTVGRLPAEKKLFVCYNAKRSGYLSQRRIGDRP